LHAEIHFRIFDEVEMDTEFPEIIECLSEESELRGEYRLMRCAESPFKLAVAPTAKSSLFYEKLSQQKVYLLYCEGVPELLPGDIWETIIAEALANNAEANMSAAVSREVKQEVCLRVGEAIKQIATDVSKDLVGWIFVSFDQEEYITTLARCIERIPDLEEALNPHSNASRTVRLSSSAWETRVQASKAPPFWIQKSVSGAWEHLVMQSGSFVKSESMLLRPYRSGPVLTRPIPLKNPDVLKSSVFYPPSIGEMESVRSSKFVWSLGDSTRVECEQGLVNFASKAFSNPFGEYFILQLRPQTKDDSFLSVSISRSSIDGHMMGFRSSFKFKISIGAATSSLKEFQSDQTTFDTVFDPRAVFGLQSAPIGIARIQALRPLSVTVEFR
jgi:hypothetical protein